MMSQKLWAFEIHQRPCFLKDKPTTNKMFRHKTQISANDSTHPFFSEPMFPCPHSPLLNAWFCFVVFQPRYLSACHFQVCLKMCTQQQIYHKVPGFQKITPKWFVVTFLGWLSDLFQRLSDLQLGHGLNHLAHVFFLTQFCVLAKSVGKHPYQTWQWYFFPWSRLKNPPTCRQHMISFIQNHIADALGTNPTFHANQLQPGETKNRKKKKQGKSWCSNTLPETNIN